jgi:hypothetical protein
VASLDGNRCHRTNAMRKGGVDGCTGVPSQRVAPWPVAGRLGKVWAQPTGRMDRHVLVLPACGADYMGTSYLALLSRTGAIRLRRVERHRCCRPAPIVAP